MHAMIWRGLYTTLLAGGFVAVGAGIASADENDLTADVAGLTATVPVDDGTVLETPAVTGTGEQLTLGDSGSAGALTLPVDTDDGGNTTVDLGEAGPIGAVSVPVTVTEADGSSPDPQDGLTVTVPVNTSDGNEDAGTTVVVPVVTGNLGEVLDGDPTTGNDVDVNLDDLIVAGEPAEGSGRDLLVDVEDLVTIGGSGDATSPRTLLAAPVSAEDGADSTVSLLAPSGEVPTSDEGILGGDALLAGNDVDVNPGDLVTDGSGGAPDDASRSSDPIVSLPVNTGALGGNGDVSGNTVDVNLVGLVGVPGADGTGSVITVPVNEGTAGTGGNNLIAVTLPVDLGGAGNGTGGTDIGNADGMGPRGDAGTSVRADGKAFVTPSHARMEGPSRLPHDGGAGSLAYTGVNALLPALLAVLALAAGLLLQVAARRRRVLP